MTRRHLHLNLNLNTTGAHRAAWRAPFGHSRGFIDIDHYVRSAELSERGLFDSVFLADYVAMGPGMHSRDSLALDPVAVAATIFSRTQSLGVIVTATTTFSEPYPLARTLSTLDHISGGRIGWNVVTTGMPDAARNFGSVPLPDSDQRYARADEFLDVAKALWASWPADALIADKATGQFADLSKVTPIDHHGHFFDVAGPLQLPQSPQGRPLLVQAGASQTGRSFAAKHADAIFTAQHTLPAALDFAADIARRADSAGRSADDIAILPGLHLTLGSTEAEAWQRIQELEELIPAEVRVAYVAEAIGIPADELEIDQPVPLRLLDGIETIASPLRGGVLEVLRSGKRTVRELSAMGIVAHQRFIGTPEQAADHMTEWFASGAVAGFNISGDVYPSGLDIIVEHLVPLLQHRGVYRREYDTRQLRTRYGTGAPA